LPESKWLVEAGIGETRAILVEKGEIHAARVQWDEGLLPGLVAEAQMVSLAAGGRRGTARFADSTEALVDQLPAGTSQGARLMLRITRAAIAERGRGKLAQARPAPGETARPAPALIDTLGPPAARTVSAIDPAFDAAGWPDLVEEALSGTIHFPGGSLIVSPTPAMTLIDVDGAMVPSALALAAVPAIVAALARFDLAGSIGIDFPTLATKTERQAVDSALADALAEGGFRGERTAMNGFGFVQLVSRLERPSMITLYAARPVAAAARVLMRRAERVAEPGALLLTAHPAVRRAVRADWLDDLARRTGRDLRWAEDAALAPAAAFAQAVPR
jgi:ribonuclease G